MSFFAMYSAFEMKLLAAILLVRVHHLINSARLAIKSNKCQALIRPSRSMRKGSEDQGHVEVVDASGFRRHGCGSATHVSLSAASAL